MSSRQEEIVYDLLELRHNRNSYVQGFKYVIET